jgi:2'-5' RNA ligase
MIRAFVGVEISHSVAQSIDVAIDQLKQLIPDIRWAALANCHLTLKFLGAIEEQQVDAIGEALQRAVAPFQRCIISAKGLGVFPDAKRPRILWVGIDGKPLASLAEAIETALAPLGFGRAQRAFTPHLTIGRWREFTASARDLRQVLEKWQKHNFGDFALDEVKLFQSTLLPTGAVYRCLKTVRLSNETASN